MLPEFDVRLRSLSKAVKQVILPALPSDERLAREQAGLILGHLRVMLLQWKYPLEFARLNARNLLALGDHLAPLAFDGEREALKEAAARLANLNAMALDAVSEASGALGVLIEEICGRPRATPADEAAFRAAIFAHARKQAEIEATWFSGMRPDVSDDAALRSLAGLSGGVGAR